MKLDALSLSEIRLVQCWADTDPGRLLLLDIAGSSEVGFRFDWPFSNGVQKSLLIVTGNNVGKTIVDANLGHPSLDVSELVEIVAKNPLPAPSAPPKPGMLVENKGGLYVWFEPMSGTGHGFVCVDHKTPHLIGGYESSLADRIIISHSIDIRRKETR
jgi:hypothetical protein